MRTAEITKEVDGLGRVVIPADIRKALNVAHGDRVSFVMSGNELIIKKVGKSCTKCGAIS